MKQFFTKNTVEAECFCKPCGKRTQWKITGGLPQHCLICFNKLEEQSKAGKEQPPETRQEGFKF